MLFSVNIDNVDYETIRPRLMGAVNILAQFALAGNMVSNEIEYA
jgi:hypothetical protein